MSLESRAASMNRDEIVALLKAHQELQQSHDELARQVAWFKRQLFGAKSERRQIDANGRQLTLGEMFRTEVQLEPEIEVPAHRRRQANSRESEATESALRFDPNVPVEVIEVENPELRGVDLASYDLIGEKVTERLAQRPGSYVVLRYVRKVYREKTSGAFSCPPAPPAVLEKSVADVSLLAGLLIDKFVYHCVPRRRGRLRQRILKRPCCRSDGSRSPGVGLQGRAPNHLELRGSKARVVSVEEKAR